MEPEKQIKTIRYHKFLNRHTVLGAILLTVWVFAAVQLIGGLVGGGISLVINAVTGKDLTTVIISLFSAALGLLMLAIHKRWFRPEFEGCLPGRHFALGFLPAVLFLAAGWIHDLIMGAKEGSLGAPSLATISASLMAGCVEEAAFRGVPGSYLMRRWQVERKIPAVMLLTSALFGLIHSSNILAGAPFGITLLQVVVSFSIGMLLCSGFLRSGSILPGMIIHTVHDIISLMNTEAYSSEGIALVETDALTTIISLAQAALFIALALYLIRPSKRAEIVALWKDKWSRGPHAPELSEETT